MLLSFSSFSTPLTLLSGFWMTLFLSPSDSVSLEEMVNCSTFCTSFRLNTTFCSTVIDCFPAQYILHPFDSESTRRIVQLVPWHLIFLPLGPLHTQPHQIPEYRRDEASFYF